MQKSALQDYRVGGDLATGADPSSAAQSSAMALTDVPQVNSLVMKTAAEAKEGLEALSKELLKLSANVSHGSLEYMTLRKGHKTIHDLLQEVNHVLMWKEFPDGGNITIALFNAWIQEKATQASNVTEQLEAIKAVLKARGLRI